MNLSHLELFLSATHRRKSDREMGLLLFLEASHELLRHSFQEDCERDSEMQAREALEICK